MKANRAYADRFGDKAALALPPTRRFAILTCMDARLDPAGFAGLAEGDAHVIRQDQGRALASSSIGSPSGIGARPLSTT